MSEVAHKKWGVLFYSKEKPESWKPAMLSYVSVSAELPHQVATFFKEAPKTPPFQSRTIDKENANLGARSPTQTRQDLSPFAALTPHLTPSEDSNDSTASQTVQRKNIYGKSILRTELVQS